MLTNFFFTAAGEKPHSCYKFPIQFLFFNCMTFHHQQECGLTIILIQKQPEISRNFSFHALPPSFHWLDHQRYMRLTLSDHHSLAESKNQWVRGLLLAGMQAFLGKLWANLADEAGLEPKFLQCFQSLLCKIREAEETWQDIIMFREETKSL